MAAPTLVTTSPLIDCLAHTLGADRSQFVVRAVADRRFRHDGIVHGRDSSAAWAIIDPRAHPMHVWQKQAGGVGAYAASATNADPVLFTNGPMMGKRLSPRSKLTARRVAWELAAATGAGAAAGLVIERGLRRRGLAAVGGLGGSISACRRCFTHWVPCGHAVSAANAIVHRSSFDDEGSRHSWLGRFSTDFSSYAIGLGNPPADVVEGLGGLILLVADYAPVTASAEATDPGRDLRELAHKRGIVAWGLVPLDLPGDRGLAGVIVVLGSRAAIDAASVARLLARLGARDAVGMDQSASVMMGLRRTFLVGPPPLHRQAMQTYGLCCL